MTNLMRAAAFVAALLSMAVVQGCREEEQGRPLSYEKGVYGGPVDAEIDDETRRALRERAKHQSFN